MICNFYVMRSDAKDAVKNLGDPVTVNVTLKEDDSSLLNPVLRISKNQIPQGVNYLFLPEAPFGRYYFIKDINFREGGVAEIVCHGDVLCSFLQELKQLSCVLRRQETNGNLYFNDDKFYVLNKQELTTVKFPNSFSKSPNLILTVNGGNGGAYES